jgi:hypothetical protein
MLIAALVALTPVAAMAQAPAKYTTADTTIGELLADPAAKAVLEKHLPQIAQAGDQAGGFTLKAIQQYAGDMVSDKVLADIDADLAKITPAKK